jgi:hypothetical protein
VDALYGVAEEPALYRKAGYRRTVQTVTWLAIDQHRNLGLKTERCVDLLMVKPLDGAPWPEDGQLDLLGYWY